PATKRPAGRAARVRRLLDSSRDFPSRGGPRRPLRPRVKPLALLPLLVLACSGGAGTERAGPWVPPEGDLDRRRGAWGAAGGEGGTAGAAAGAFGGSGVCGEGEAREDGGPPRVANG